MNKIFLDTETTGLSPNDGDRIVEIAAIAYNDRTPILAEEGGEYHKYINPQRNMPAEAQEVHGLSDQFLADKPLFTDIADSFISFIRDKEIIIHNAEFDRGFLDAELNRAGKPPLNQIAAAVTCSLTWSRTNNPNLSAHNLNALCKHFNINLSARSDYHSALVDTHLLADLYFMMRQQQVEMKITMPPIDVPKNSGDVPIIRANEKELNAHNNFLNEMEKETGTTPLYKRPPS